MFDNPKKYSKLIIISLLLIIALSSPKNLVYSQDTNLPQLDDDELVYWRDNELRILRHTTWEDTFYFSYMPPVGGYFIDMDLDREAGLLYVAEKIGEIYGFENRDSQIVQIDLSTGERTILWEGINLLSFESSPDRSQMLVNSLEAFSQTNANRPFQEYCILSLDTGDCRSITDEIPLHVALFWFDNETLYYRWSQDIMLVDVETFESRQLVIDGWIIDDFEMFDQNKLVVLAHHDSSPSMQSFLEMDLETSEVTQLSFIPRLNGQNMGTHSPDGRYLIYGTYITQEFKDIVEVIDLQNEEHFQTDFINLRCCIQWFPDSRGFITIIRVDTEDHHINNIVYIDPQLHHSGVIATYQVDRDEPLIQAAYIPRQ